MKSLKRIIASTLSVLMILASLLTVNVFADTVVFPDVADDYAYKNAIYSLVEKGVINGIEENGVLTFKPFNTITRAEFAKLVAAALTSGVVLTETTTQFPDVAADYWANPYIAYAVKTGIVNGYPDGTFGPTNPVTYGEAIKMLVCAKGYGAAYTPTEPWYDGYIRLANQIELTKNAYGLGTNPAPRGLVAQLIYNLDHCKKIDINIGGNFGGGIPSIDNSDDYVEATGVVQGVFNTTLTGQSLGLNKIQVMIGGNVYEIGDFSLDKFYPYLGKMLTFEYSDEATDVIKNIVSVGNSDSITIQAGDIDQIDGYTIKYYENDKSSKISKANLSDELYVIYNGSGVKTSDIKASFIEEYFDIDCGEITLVDNDGGRDYEVAYVTDYKTYYVTSVSEKDDVYKITDNKANQTVELNEEDCTVYRYSATGSRSESKLSDINTNNVISVAKPYDRTEGTEVIISAITEKNKSVDEMSGDEYVEINNKEYSYSNYFTRLRDENPENYELSIGDVATFYFDYQGKLVFFTKTESTDPYAYVCGFDTGSGINGQCKIYLFAISGTSGTAQVWPLKDTVRVNGVNEDAKDVKGILLDNAEFINENYDAKIENGDYSQLIKYKTSISDGNTYISEIYTIDKDDIENGEIVPAQFRTEASGDKTEFSDGIAKLTYNTSSKSFKDAGGSNQFIINASTVIIQVPKDRGDATEFKKRTLSYFSNDGTYVVEPYDVKSNVAKAVLVYDGSTGATVYYGTDAVFIDKISKTSNSDDKSVNEVTYYVAGESSAKTILTKDLTILDGIKAGDIVKFATEDNVVVNVQEVFVDGVLYDWTSDPFDTKPATGNFIEHGTSSTPNYYQVIHGTVDSMDIEDGSGNLTIVPMIVDDHSDYDSSDWENFVINSSVKVYEWDSKSNEFTVNDSSNAGSLMSVEVTKDAANSSQVVVVVLDRKVKAIYILN